MTHRTVICVLLVVVVGVALACSLFQDDGETSQGSVPTQSQDDDEIFPVQSQDGSKSIQESNQPKHYPGERGSSPLPYDGDFSLEERIANYPTIVKATLDRVTSEVVPAGGRWTGEYVIAVKFHLTVSEYLNGSGATNIIAFWGSSNSYETRSAAEAARPGLVAQRDTTYDDREAIIFMTSEFWDLFDTLKAKNTYEVASTGDFLVDDFMSVTSRYAKLWLPAVAVIDGASQTDDSQEFLLAAPGHETARQQARGFETNATSTSPMLAQQQADPPTITLRELKTKIAAVNAELNGGDGSDAYKRCIKAKYLSERVYSHRESEGRTVTVRQDATSHHTMSGGPADTVLYTIPQIGTYPDKKDFKTWLDGGDASLFKIVYSPMTPVDDNHDGKLEAGVDITKYTESLLNTRPLHDGRYAFNINDLSDIAMPCNDVDTYEWTVTVTAPTGTLHEAFFDPVTVGLAIAADATNGVLKPTSFTDANNAAATLQRIAYESPSTGSGQAGTVKLKLSPHTGLANHVVDFIALDGKVSLSLEADEATVDAANNTLTWSVSSQPWEDGDKLMVRIREAR